MLRSNWKWVLAWKPDRCSEILLMARRQATAAKATLNLAAIWSDLGYTSTGIRAKSDQLSSPLLPDLGLPLADIFEY